MFVTVLPISKFAATKLINLFMQDSITAEDLIGSDGATKSQNVSNPSI